MRITTQQALLLTISIGTWGCGASHDPRVPVAGKVLVDGQPLTSGIIRFVPESGRPASSTIQADGSFQLASARVGQSTEHGVPRGTYRVQVSASTIVDDKTIRWSAPQKFADFRTSGLSTTIDGPTDNLIIQLTWADEQPSRAEAESVGESADVKESTPPPNSSRPEESSQPDVESAKP